MDFRSIGNMRYAKIYQFLRLYPRFPRVPAPICADLCAIHSRREPLICTTCAGFVQACVLIVITGFDPAGAAGRQVRDFVAYGPVCRAQAAPGERGRACRPSCASIEAGVLQGVLRGFAFFSCFDVFAARSCAAYGCVSSRVAASGGQGGLGGLRFPPKSSLDSPITP